ncbi:hypothetical protein EDB85DRAFT_2154337 [Lactarius pseudohatsudake]|nr:hypothetical protein EDB85DRAFT_2154337 [Lactarius pseudohatsudake]
MPAFFVLVFGALLLTGFEVVASEAPPVDAAPGIEALVAVSVDVVGYREGDSLAVVRNPDSDGSDAAVQRYSTCGLDGTATARVLLQCLPRRSSIHYFHDAAYDPNSDTFTTSTTRRA